MRTQSSAMIYLRQLKNTIVERNHSKPIVVIFGNCVSQVDISFVTMCLATHSDTGGKVGVGVGMERTEF